MPRASSSMIRSVAVRNSGVSTTLTGTDRDLRNTTPMDDYGQPLLAGGSFTPLSSGCYGRPRLRPQGRSFDGASVAASIVRGGRGRVLLPARAWRRAQKTGFGAFASRRGGERPLRLAWRSCRGDTRQ